MIKIKNLPVRFRTPETERKLEKICQKNDIKGLFLFGSFLRGQEKKKSDIDLLVYFDEKIPKSLFDLVHAENGLEKVFGRKVDLLTPNSISRYFRDGVLDSAIKIYEKR